MAPVFVACRLLPSLFVFTLSAVLCSSVTSLPTLLQYDRQTLLVIRSSMDKLFTFLPSGFDAHLPPARCQLPSFFCRLPFIPRWKKRRRRRGTRGGFLVKLKASLSSRQLPFQCYSLMDSLKGKDSSITLRSMEIPYQWITPVLPATRSDFPLSSRPKFRSQRVNLQNLRSLQYESGEQKPSAKLKFALINVRSLASKTFIL